MVQDIVMTHSPKPPKAGKPDPAPKPPPGSKNPAPAEPPAGQKEQAKTEKKPSLDKLGDKLGDKKVGGRIEIPLISTPNDQVEMEQEMEDLFNEEKVKHHHGGSEPERD
jgi:hypothetical protein